MFLSYGQNPEREPLESDAEKVRSTITVVDDSQPASVADDRPSFNRTETDPETEGGLTPHQVAPFVTPSERYVNPMLAEANIDHNRIVNDQVSTSGTAAAREAAGQWGHGTMGYADSVEPLYSEADLGMGEAYFDADRPDFGSADRASGVQADASADPASKVAAARAEANARAAAEASQYAAFYHNATGLG